MAHLLCMCMFGPVGTSYLQPRVLAVCVMSRGRQGEVIRVRRVWAAPSSCSLPPEEEFREITESAASTLNHQSQAF